MNTEEKPLEQSQLADEAAPENEVDELAALEDAFYAGQDPETDEAKPEVAEPTQTEEVETPKLEAEALEAKAEADEPQPTPEGMMPYGAYASERDKRKSQEAELEELRKFKEEQELRQSVEARVKKPGPMPDPIADFDGFQRHIGDDLSAMRQEMFLMQSERAAEREFGPEVVAAAQKAVQAVAQSRPDIQARLVHAANPHAEAVAIHREMEILSDPDAYKAKIIAEYQAGLSANPAQPQTQPAQAGTTAAPPPQTPSLPPNIAGATSALGVNTEPSFEDIEDQFYGK